MSDGFTVDVAALAGHATQVEGITDGLGTAAGAAQPLGLGDYSLIGQVFTVVAIDAVAECSTMVAAMPKASGALATGVRDAATAYAECDATIGGWFGGGR